MIKMIKNEQKRVKTSKKIRFLTKNKKRQMSLYERRIGGFWLVLDNVIFNNYMRLKVNIHRYFETKNLSFPFYISSRDSSFNLLIMSYFKIVHFLSKNTLFLFKTVFFLSNCCFYSTIC